MYIYWNWIKVWFFYRDALREKLRWFRQKPTFLFCGNATCEGCFAIFLSPYETFSFFSRCVKWDIKFIGYFAMWSGGCSRRWMRLCIVLWLQIVNCCTRDSAKHKICVIKKEKRCHFSFYVCSRGRSFLLLKKRKHFGMNCRK